MYSGCIHHRGARVPGRPLPERLNHQSLIQLCSLMSATCIPRPLADPNPAGGARHPSPGNVPARRRAPAAVPNRTARDGSGPLHDLQPVGNAPLRKPAALVV